VSLSQYILDAREQYRLQIREHSTLLTRVRWYYIAILSVLAVVTSMLTNDNSARTLRIALFAGGSGLAVNTILWALTKLRNQKVSYYQAVTVAQTMLDITLASAIIYLQEGLAARSTILYAIPIVGAGLLFTRFFAYITAILCGAAYALTLIVYQLNNTSAYEPHMITLPAVFYAAVFIVIALIISAYRERAMAKEREQSYAELLSLLRHQLYHPSGVIAAIIDMLEHGEHYPGWPAGDKTYLQQLKRENKRLHTMVANALESINPSSAKPERIKVFDIVQLLNEEAVSCATGAKRVADLKTRLPNKIVEVEGDQTQLGVAFDNIIENAFRYTEKGTPVSVSIKEENLKVIITVEDKGEGMSEERQKLLFKLFSKIEDRIGGDTKEQAKKLYDMGLGLYVSKLIIERHRGQLDLVSGKSGTKITVTLYGRLL
jgi:signal transduction histidine kinase